MSNNTQLNKKKYFHQIYRFSKGNNYNNFESDNVACSCFITEDLVCIVIYLKLVKLAHNNIMIQFGMYE